MHLGPLEDGRPVEDVAAQHILLRRRADEVGDHVRPVPEDVHQPRLLLPLRVLAARWLLVEAVPALTPFRLTRKRQRVCPVMVSRTRGQLCSLAERCLPAAHTGTSHGRNAHALFTLHTADNFALSHCSLKHTLCANALQVHQQPSAIDTFLTATRPRPAWNASCAAHHCILPPPTSEDTKYCPLPRNTR